MPEGKPEFDVFLSYNNEDQAGVERVAQALEERGLRVWFDKWELRPGLSWIEGLEQGVNTSGASAAFIGRSGLGPWQKREVQAALIRHVDRGYPVIPVLLPGCPENPRTPLFLDQHTWVNLRENAQFEEGLQRLIWGITGNNPHDFAPPPAPPQVCLAKLPITSPDLFGRERELAILDEAWDAHTHLVTIIAFGGIGKSALINNWLQRMDDDNYRGAWRVLGWSFYSQGSRDTAVSADQFINAALIFFGDPDPTAGSPWEKGERLAQLIREEPTLLVLDGLEPLQSTLPGEEGRIKDPALDTLLRELRAGNNGLCVISSRVEVSDLHASDTSGPVRRIELERLSTEAGRHLLKHHKIRGLDSELGAAVEEFGGHALALVLLIEYLRAFLESDIARRDEVPSLDQETRQGRHAFRVMEAYDLALRRDGREVERAILRLIGLFDRPASADCLAALRREPAIRGVTDALVKLSETDWRHAVHRLRELRLLVKPDDDDGSLDAHPLVRECFGPKLEAGFPEGFRAAHRRLYEHLRDHGKPTPDTKQDRIEDLQPLFQAVHHGCRGGLYHDALDKVYRRRIQRQPKYEGYSTFQLGGVASELAALSGFFQEPWSVPVNALPPRDEAYLLDEVGYDLQEVGRGKEATGPLERSLVLYKQLEQWDDATGPAATLVDVYLSGGDLAALACAAAQSVEVANHCEDMIERVRALTDPAVAHHVQGHLAHALAAFLQAEDLQHREANKRGRYLNNLAGTQYCSLLLDLGSAQTALKRARWILRSAVRRRDRLDRGLACLAVGRALHQRLAIREAQQHFESAWQSLRDAASMPELPKALLARAAFLRDTGDRPGAFHDLHEGLDLSTRIGLRLHETDARLLAGHLALDKEPPAIETAQAAFSHAEELVEQTGYHLRDADLLILEGRLLGKRGEKSAARGKLEEAIKVARREEAEGCVYQVAVDQAERYLRELEGEGK